MTVPDQPMPAYQPAPADDGSYIHPVRRASLMVARAIGYLVYAYVIVVEVILLLGFFLLLFGANSSASFVDWIYRALNRAMQPFRGVFTPIDLGAAGSNEVNSVLDTSVLFAMIVYAIAALVLSGFVSWLGSRLARLDDDNAEYHRRRAMENMADAYRGSVPPPPGTSNGYPPAPPA